MLYFLIIKMIKIRRRGSKQKDIRVVVNCVNSENNNEIGMLASNISSSSKEKSKIHLV